jgi:drug/metabolite transporter (DMT)-like permease
LPAPKPYWRLALVGVLMGAGNFGLFFLGMKDAVFFDEALYARLLLGGAVVLSGVLVIVLRRTQMAAMMAALRSAGTPT